MLITTMRPQQLPTGVILTLLIFLPPPSAYAQQLVPSMESPLFAWTNIARTHYGRPPVTSNAKLTRAAQLHALNMAAQETMSHSLDGKTFVDRVQMTGYPYAMVAENVAWNFGYQHPAWQLFDGWMKSEGHYRNIMNEQFTELGVGVARSPSGKFYACQVFGRPAAAAPSAVPYWIQETSPARQPSQQSNVFYWYYQE